MNDNKKTVQKRSNRSKRNGKAKWSKEFDKTRGSNYQDKFALEEKLKGAKYAIETGASKDNDPNWYAANEKLLRDAASIPFNHISGIPLTENYKNQAPVGMFRPQSETYPTPGVMTLYIFPTIGQANVATDPINQASFNEYAYIRHINSGSDKYQAADLGIYNVAVTNIYAFYAFLIRAYGCINNWSMTDRYTPITLFTAMKLDYDSLSTNIANFRMLINNIAYRAQTFGMPQSITYLTRQVWMYQNLYRDTETNLAQYYMYSPLGFWYFDEATEAGPGQLKFLNLTSYLSDDHKLLDLNDLAQIANTMLNPLLGSSATQWISRDIVHSFKDAGLFRMAGIDEGFKIEPQYSKEVMSQMENAVIVGTTTTGTTTYGSWTGSITQNVSNLNTGTYLQASYSFSEDYPEIPGSWNENNAPLVIGEKDTKFINMHKEDVSAGDVMVATRLMSGDFTVTNITPNESYETVTYNVGLCGSEICAGADVYYYTGNATGIQGPVAFNSVRSNYIEIINSSPTQANQYNMVRDIVKLVYEISLFDWHPIIRFSIINAHSGTAEDRHFYHGGQPICEMDNFTTIDEITLRNMHEIALLSEFACNDMGAFSPKR